MSPVLGSGPLGAGAVDIGRLPGFVQLSLLVPRDRLGRLGILHLVEAQYGAAAG